MSVKDKLLTDYCNDPILSDSDIIELFDSEGMVITKSEIEYFRNNNQSLSGKK